MSGGGVGLGKRTVTRGRDYTSPEGVRCGNESDVGDISTRKKQELNMVADGESSACSSKNTPLGQISSSLSSQEHSTFDWIRDSADTELLHDATLFQPSSSRLTSIHHEFFDIKSLEAEGRYEDHSSQLAMIDQPYSLLEEDVFKSASSLHSKDGALTQALGYGSATILTPLLRSQIDRDLSESKSEGEEMDDNGGVSLSAFYSIDMEIENQSLSASLSKSESRSEDEESNPGTLPLYNAYRVRSSPSRNRVREFDPLSGAHFIGFSESANNSTTPFISQDDSPQSASQGLLPPIAESLRYDRSVDLENHHEEFGFDQGRNEAPDQLYDESDFSLQEPRNFYDMDVEMDGVNALNDMPLWAGVFGTTLPWSSSWSSHSDFGHVTVSPISGQVMTDAPFADVNDLDEDFERNQDACEFFEYWRMRYQRRSGDFPPIRDEALNLRGTERPTQISAEELQGDRCDLQGIDWVLIGADRGDARAVRNKLYTSYQNLDDGLSTRCPSTKLRRSDDNFRFSRLSCHHKAHLSHFQLRNIMAAPSRNSIFYAGRSVVYCVDTTLQTKMCVMDFTKASKHDGVVPKKISSLAASNDILAVGGFGGEYAIKSLFAENDGSYVAGTLTLNENSITNHVHTFPGRRSGLPQAVFCSNDRNLRVLDTCTNTFLHTHTVPWPVNCSATSPNGRMRLVVGDDREPLVLDAETGRTITVLRRHRDYGFACDWGPDGWSMATGNQDGVVQIWDARNWGHPIHNGRIATEIGGIRSLHFSPLGGGRPALLMAEPADIVSIVDAVTFGTVQRFDFFGEIAGTGFVNDGSAFYVANSDSVFGGLMEFERVRWGGSEEASPVKIKGHSRHGYTESQYYDSLDEEEAREREKVTRKGVDHMERDDWIPDEELDNDSRVLAGSRRRRWRGLGQADLHI